MKLADTIQIDGGLPPFVDTLPLRGLDTLPLAFGPDVEFERCHRPEDRDRQPSRAGGRVDGLIETAEADALLD